MTVMLRQIGRFYSHTLVVIYVVGLITHSMGMFRSWGSSVSKVSDYRLDGFSSIPGRGKRFFFSSLYVQTSSEAHPASYPVGTGGPFPGVKRGRGVTLTPSSVEVQNEELHFLTPIATAWQ
jgi:hypothetical protein